MGTRLVDAAITPMAYSVKDTAKSLGVCAATVDRMIKDGRLPAVRVGKRKRLVPIAALDAFLATAK